MPWELEKVSHSCLMFGPQDQAWSGRLGGQCGALQLGAARGRARLLSVECQWRSVLVINISIVTESEVSLDIDKGGRARIIHVVYLEIKLAPLG